MRALFCALFLIAGVLQAQPVIVASGELASDTRDATGTTIGGIGSGMAYDEKNDVYFATTDRGAGDGTLPYTPRFVVLKIDQTGDKLVPKLLDSISLRDEQGREMTGLIPDDPEAQTPRMKDGRTCIDPEAIALAPDGTLYLTDEYGPCLYQFARDGKMIRRIALPGDFHPRTAGGKLDYTDKAELVSGRDINQGPEGMCLLPEENAAMLVFQRGLVQDGGRKGARMRILKIDLASGKPLAMYSYLPSPDVAGIKAAKISLNDLAHLGGTRFLVLERDGSGRDGAAKPEIAKYKSIWLIDTAAATDLLEAQAGKEPVPVKKELLFNLAKLVDDPRELAAKWETVLVLPPVKDNEVDLLMAADNDFLTPVIHENGNQHAFPRAEDAVPTQFFKIRCPLPENS